MTQPHAQQGREPVTEAGRRLLDGLNAAMGTDDDRLLTEPEHLLLYWMRLVEAVQRALPAIEREAANSALSEAVRKGFLTGEAADRAAPALAPLRKALLAIYDAAEDRPDIRQIAREALDG